MTKLEQIFLKINDSNGEKSIPLHFLKDKLSHTCYDKVRRVRDGDKIRKSIKKVK